MSVDYHVRSNRDLLSRWRAAIGRVFPTAVPEGCRWTDPADVSAVLGVLAAARAASRMFVPSGGSFELQGAKRSAEPDCVEMTLEQATIVRPVELTFHSFGEGAPEWCYLRLEAARLRATGAGQVGADCESVIELAPGKYGSGEDAGSSTCGDKGEACTARRVTRYWKGAFVLVAAASPYSSVPQTDDARHARMSAAEFHEVMRRAFDRAREGRRLSSQQLGIAVSGPLASSA
jgi:hypothetical protein